MGATFVGMPPFPKAAHTALADTQLRANLAHATRTIREKRALVVGEVDDWEALRSKAARIKDETLAHLDDHRRLSAHISKSSWMMAGSRISLEFDEAGGELPGKDQPARPRPGCAPFGR